MCTGGSGKGNSGNNNNKKGGGGGINYSGVEGGIAELD